MKGMTVKAYLETVAKICTFEEAAGRCMPKSENENACPLADFDCGTPKEPEDIDEVLKIVASYKMPPEGGCVKCGADIREMRKQGIKYCPFCGSELKPCES